jgi:hypothetical protein
MKLLRYLVITAAAGLALATSADPTQAQCPTCGLGVGHGMGLGHGLGGGRAPTTLLNGLGAGPGMGGFGGKKQQLPLFQAAPWYQYWPYDGHFLMPAPVSGPFYGPPLTGNFPTNPYFPGPAMPVGPNYGYGQGIPGGAPPLMQPRK